MYCAATCRLGMPGLAGAGVPSLLMHHVFRGNFGPRATTQSLALTSEPLPKRRFSVASAAARVRRGMKGGAVIPGFVMPDSQTITSFHRRHGRGHRLFRLFTVLGRRTGQEPHGQASACPAGPPAPQPAAGASALLQRPSGYPARRPRVSTRPNSSPGRARPISRSSRLSPPATAAPCARCCRPMSLPPSTPASAQRTAPAAAFVKLHDARITGSALNGRIAEITVAFARRVRHRQCHRCVDL